ncbi:vesicle transport v-snare 13 [Anaeramoeba ignava]|uniref:Vesicle transport v-snare 13 n=1 Tax=Anaeramoeba ignava TaxID=1746090 RepID=A0A9Q0L8L5_ANAIG|nr:vesicle transport v-snare 13 [Anaeramoeba ignava]|eukprot:Anaeramoba_ignava/a219360_126.p1 GENE.a219360_126~~a219360_126.p1  ORF type:complete len:223 (-),score=56.72 a219360_126:23-691(-)
MEMFDSYEQDFNDLSVRIKDRIEKIKELTGEEKKKLKVAADRELDEAHELIQQMDSELRGFSVDERKDASKKLRKYKNQYQNFQTELRKAYEMSSYSQDRNDLFDGRSDYQVQNLDQRQKLLQAQNTLDNSSQRLQNAHKTALQSEQIGTEILADLHQQGDTLRGAHKKLQRAEENVDKGGNIISRMFRRAVTNKIILIIIIIVLLGIIAMIVYFTRFYKKK